MPKAPDWLLQMTNDASGLVEDSPQYRKAENQHQTANLANASREALGMVQNQTLDAQKAAAAAGIQALKSGKDHIARMTPTPTPLMGPSSSMMSKPQTSNVPPPEEFTSSPNVTPPPDVAPTVTPGDPAAVADPNQPLETDPNENIQDTIMQIAQASGLSPQTVAMMTMMGKDIERNMKESGQDTPEPAPEPTLPSPAPTQPNFGINTPPTAPVPPPVTPPPSPMPSPLLQPV